MLYKLSFRLLFSPISPHLTIDMMGGLIKHDMEVRHSSKRAAYATEQEMIRRPENGRRNLKKKCYRSDAAFRGIWDVRMIDTDLRKGKTNQKEISTHTIYIWCAH